MKSFVRNFVFRGMMFAWIGPAVLAMVWASLQSAGVIRTLTVSETVLGILSITLMAFIAAGSSCIYQIEKLPAAFAALIHAAVLYLDYLCVYLLNGWIPFEKIWFFTVIFAAGFLLIWFFIYLSVKRRVDKMNRMMPGTKDRNAA